MGNEREVTALLIGDICGKPGSRALFLGLPQLIKKTRADVVVVNGENAADGLGINAEQVRQFLALGVQVITTGNHVWHQEDVYPLLESEPRLLRPANYPPQAPGTGSVVYEAGHAKIAVVNLQGRMQMAPIDCPFRTGLALVEKLKRQTPLVIVDFHAEATSEKEAIGWYLDGRVSAVLGTHTHVQTADERILPLGTAYITDAGMTGPFDSVIGMDTQVALKRFIRQIPEKYRPATSNNRLNGVLLEIDAASGRAIRISRVNLP